MTVPAARTLRYLQAAHPTVPWISHAVGPRRSLPYPCLRWDADPGYIHVAVQKIKLCLKGQNQTKDKKEGNKQSKSLKEKAILHNRERCNSSLIVTVS